MKLYIYKPIRQEKQESAYMMEDIKSYVKSEIQEMAEHYNELASAYHTAHSTNHDIPDTIDTETKDTSGLTDSKHTALELKVDEQNSKLNTKLDNLMTMIQHQNNSSRNNNSYHNNSYQQRPRTWRQLNKYCWTHSVCGHNSKACKAPNANHQKDATYSNRKGGSNKGLDNWKKWQSPNGQIQDSKGSE